MAWEIKSFDSSDALVAGLSSEIASILRSAVEDRGRATMAVSGGSTPKPLFARLASVDVHWDRVTVTLVDERWVDENHPDSNARLVKNSLIQDKAANASFIPLKTAHAEPFGAENEVAQRLRSSVAMPFDLVILGMGADGHTASFFSGASTLAKALAKDGEDLCCAIRPPSAPHDRMTLTLPAILSTRHLFLHIVGEDKWQVLERAFQSGSAEELPIRAVLHQDKVLLNIFYAAE